eukprot:6711283-Alexandrium_andersonii.AAC.2
MNSACLPQYCKKWNFGDEAPKEPPLFQSMPGQPRIVLQQRLDMALQGSGLLWGGDHACDVNPPVDRDQSLHAQSPVSLGWLALVPLHGQLENCWS